MIIYQFYLASINQNEPERSFAYFWSKLVLGTPQKAESLPGRKCSAVFDPRPQKQNHVDKNMKLHSLMVNYVYDTNHDLSLRYVFPRADLQTAANDHDYLERPFTEFWVINRNKVGITNHTNSKV